MYTHEKGSTLKKTIDFIVYDEQLRGFTEDTLRGSECGTGHYLIASRIVPGKKWAPNKKDRSERNMDGSRTIAESSSLAGETIRN